MILGCCIGLSGENHFPPNASFRIATLKEGSISIATKVEDNTLCLGCHATHAPFDKITPDQVAHYADNRTAIGAIVSSHSNHPYGPERSMGLSRCTQCHMATTGGPGELKLPRPEGRAS